MRPMTKKNKIAAVAASAALVAVGGGAAYAYWSTTGSGSGSANASPGTQAVVLHTAFDDGIAPSGTRTVTYTADNPNSSSTTVGGLVATVTTSTAACDPGWFSVTAPSGTTSVAKNSTGTMLGTGTLTFTDLAINQDGCKGATIYVGVTSN